MMDRNVRRGNTIFIYNIFSGVLFNSDYLEENVGPFFR